MHILFFEDKPTRFAGGQERSLFEMAERYNYRIHTIIVENRHGGENIHGVPKEKLQQMKDRFQIKM